MLCQLFIIQVCSPANPILFKFNVTVFHFDRIGQNNATPIFVKLIKYFMYEKIGCCSVEMRAYQRAKRSLRAVGRSHAVVSMNHAAYLFGGGETKILRFQLYDVNRVMAEQFSKLLGAVIIFATCNW